MSDDTDEIQDLLNLIEDTGPISSGKLEEKVEERKRAENKKEKGPSGVIEIQPSTLFSDLKKQENAEPETKVSVVPAEHDTETVADELINQFGEAISRFDSISGQILKDYETDREQAQAAVSHFFQVIEQGGKVPRIYVEKLADILRAKTEINMIPIRLLDSITKFMAASKNNNIMIQNVNQGGPDLSNLEKLLDDAKAYPDEEIG